MEPRARRRSARAGPKLGAIEETGVDWAAVERQLNNIPADFKSQKFNSLKRVIEILGKDKPQWALAEARALPQFPAALLR
jgi:hypothetical protein